MTDTVPAANTPPGGAPEPTSALGVPAFRAFWINGLTFFLVSNALRFVYGWVVLDGLGRGEAWQGVTVFVLGIPAIVLMLPAGVWADRVDPKRLLLVSQVLLLATMAATALAIGDGSGSLGLMIGSALLAGVASTIGGPVRQSLVPALLPPKLLYSGIAVNAIAITLSLVAGAVAARQFGDWFGFDGAFWWQAGLLLVGIVALSAMRSPGPSTSERAPAMREAIGEGLRFVWDHRGIRTLFFLLGVSGLVISPAMFVTIQAHVKTELGRSAGDAAPVLAIMGIGIAVSSMYIMRRGSLAHRGLRFMRAMIGGTSMISLMGLTTQYWQTLAVGFVLGMCGGFFINLNQGLIQSNTPQDVMGRVMGLYALVQLGLTPVGAAIGGLVAEAVGTRWAISGAGILGLTAVIATYVTARSLREMS